MSFLTPLFLLGGAAILAPIILHLIRRQTQGELTFSSLMFLEASPPTMMRRSRIDQWLLLLLRALAILLLVAAFARPFWRTEESVSTSPSNTRRAILLDVSASMKRDTVWPEALQRARQLIDEYSTQSTVCFYTFDDQLKPILSVDEALSKSPNENKAMMLASLSALAPTYRATDLGSALATIAERLSQDDAEDESSTEIECEIFVISDCLAGSAIDRLESFQWPAHCRLSLERVGQAAQSNVAAGLLESTDAKIQSVRLTNRGSDQTKLMSVEWLDEQGQPLIAAPASPTSETSKEISLPTKVEAELPGEGTVVVRLPRPESDTVILQLRGDTSDFDNRRWIARPPQRRFELVCIDDEKRETPTSLGYFLQQLPLSDVTRDVKFRWRAPGSLEALPDVKQSPWIVASHLLTLNDAEKIADSFSQGRHLLWVWDKPVDHAETKGLLLSVYQALTGDVLSKLDEASDDREAMLEKIDYTHPLFRSLADTRFNDFTKIRFWNHRRVDFDDLERWQVVARFDDDAPAIASRQIGDGKLWIMASGWQPAESQLALSSKFVPIVTALFQQSLPPQRSLQNLEIGDEVLVEAGESWTDPRHTAMPIDDRDEGKYIVFEEPGFYRVTQSDQSRSVAVNVPMSESDTRPLELERLERLGVIFDEKKDADRVAMNERLRKNVELEKDQRLWRWCMIGMLGIIVVETLYASRPSR